VTTTYEEIWNAEALKAMIEEDLALLAPDDDLTPNLWLESPTHGRALCVIDGDCFHPENKRRFLREQLPRMIKSQQPTRAALITAAWFTGEMSPLEEAAFDLHMSRGGRIADWPGRIDGVQVTVVEQDGPCWLLVGRVERHPDSHPTISTWDESREGISGEIVKALRAGVRRKRSSRTPKAGA
jgi:hypothetical protein